LRLKTNNFSSIRDKKVEEKKISKVEEQKKHNIRNKRKLVEHTGGVNGGNQ